MIKQLLVISTLIFSAKTLAESKVQLEVTKKVLPNGITVLIQENHKIPLVSYQSWFDIGSRNEVHGKTGLAHLFEHVMFTGTPKYPANELEKLLEKSGITHNAFTSHDCTVYHEDLPSEKLELIMDLESDRFKNLKLTQEVFNNEKKIVQEERLMRAEQSLEGMMSEKLWALAFEEHPYKNPVIGWPQDLEKLTLKDAQEFFKQHYKPSNLIISIAGDVDTAKTLALLEKYYGDIPKSEKEGLSLPAPKPLDKEKKIQVVRDIKAERLLIGYRIDRQGEPSSLALDLAAMIIGQGRTSRLYKKLFVENQLASGLGVDAHTAKDGGLFEIDVRLKVGVRMEKALAVIDEEIAKLRETLVSAAELQKTKRKMMRETYGVLLTAHGRSHNLALNEMISGNYADLFNDLEKYEKVTPEDIKAAAQKFLNSSNRVIVELKAGK